MCCLIILQPDSLIQQNVPGGMFLAPRIASILNEIKLYL